MVLHFEVALGRSESRQDFRRYCGDVVAWAETLDEFRYGCRRSSAGASLSRSVSRSSAEITVRRYNWVRLNQLRFEFLTKSATGVIDGPS